MVPENQDKARTRMSNGPIIDRFFGFFEEVINKYNLSDKPEQVSII